MTKKLYFYIAKQFLTTLLLVMLSISLLIAMINIFGILNKIDDNNISFIQIVLLDILQIPSFLEDISIFLIMLSAMITLFLLSVRSEITVMRVSGLSFLQITSPITSTSFIIGILYLLVFNSLSIIASKKFNYLEKTLIKQKEIDSLYPEDGIWLKQPNILQNNEEIIIRADSIHRKNLKMDNVSFWFFNQNQQFYKKINASYVELKDKHWHLKNVILNDKDNINQKIPELTISTSLETDFIIKKILNNFKNVRFFSIYNLPELIKDLKNSGSSPRKFIVQYYSMLAKPFLFAATALLGAFFAANNIRNKNNIYLFVSGIISGLILYIISIVISAFGSSGLIPIFLSTWMVAIILLATSMLLIFKKEGSY